MANPVKFIDGTEQQILSLTSDSVNWIEKAFYYPTDKSYFYRIVNGEMVKYGDVDISVTGVGITLNDKIIGGVKNVIEFTDILQIPENYEYNLLTLQVDGVINCNGTINILQ